MISKWMKFLKIDLWRMRERDLPPKKSIIIRFVRIIVLAFRGFNENNCLFRASALTFYTLLSIVPIIALMFAIAKGFGLQEHLVSQLNKIQGQEAAVAKIIEFSNAMLESTNGGLIAGVGVAFLFWTIIRVLSHIENSFNEIWGIVQPRTFARKFGDYLSMMLVCPILLVFAGSLTVIVNTQIQNLMTKIPLLQNLGLAFWLPLKVLPYVTGWVLLTFIFALMPNTKVKFSSAIIAGVVAGTLFQFVQWVYFNFQIGVTKANAVYGSFAAIPLFLIWLQTSWLIVLFGAEVSFAHQNVETYEFEPDCMSASRAYKTLLSLLITHTIVKRFCNEEKPLDASAISRELEIPIRLVRQLLYQLTESGILSEVKHTYKEFAYQPANDVDKMTIKYIIDKVDQNGTANVPVAPCRELEKISESLKKFGQIVQNSDANILLKNM
ncbi:MAG: ribonuclease BN [Planctomycetes bacterium GWF2_42_9]|nr:MAG: ribonuclease BN [Planctomycetes bacterium GWF2_42_9]HAL45962.1 YihY/virulence factor BrkB family protein [Phycisphaerales bacterium]